MLEAYLLERHRLTEIPSNQLPAALPSAIWIQLVEPTVEELAAVQALYGFPFPSLEEIEELEASAHHVAHDEALQFNTLFLHTLDGTPQNTNVCIIMCEKRVVSLAPRELPAMRLLRRRSAHDPMLIDDPESIVLNLMEIKVDGLADELEDATRKLEALSAKVLQRVEVDFEESLDVLAVQENLNGKVRIALMDAQRDLTFLLRRGRFDSEQAEWIQELLRDVETLLPHNAFLTEKVNFLLNSAMGFINLEQNKIIKTFSIAAVVFLPPTLVASIYGMNFSVMPELSMRWGYPLALGLMVASAIAPYLYFKRKGWL